MGNPDPASDVTLEDVRSVFSQSTEPGTPLSTAEVAEGLECSDRAAANALEPIAERGDVQSRRVDDQCTIWWRPAAAGAGTDDWSAGVDRDDPSDRDEPNHSDDQSGSQQSELEEFGAFVSAVEDYAIFTLDPDGVVATWNEGAERIKGYEESEIVDESFATFYTEADRADGIPERNLEVAATEGRVEDEGWRVHADGSTFWANVVITAIRDEDGALQGFTKVTRDMTEQREYEQRLRRQRDLTEQLVATVPVSICSMTADGEYVRANQRMLDRLGIDESELSEYSVDSWELYDTEGAPIPTEEWPWRQVIDTGEPVYDFECAVDLPNLDERWFSINAAPIEEDRFGADNLEEDRFGADDLEEDRLEDGRFGAGEFDAEQFDASRLGTDDQQYGDERVVLSVDDVTAQKDRERQLRREHEQTQKLLRTAPIAIAVQDADGETVMANRRAQEALGLTEEEFIDEPEDVEDWTVYDESGSEVPPAEMPAARVLASGEPVYDQELVIDPPSGDRIRFRVNAAPVFGTDGEIERVITTAEDVTELKRREQQLEQRKDELETELSEILGRVSDAFYALDEDWRFTHLNDRAAELVQRPEDELLGQKVWDVFPDAEGGVYWETFHGAMESQEPASFEEYVEGLGAWFEFNVYPSESGLSIYFHDVTQRKEYQRKLEESNERLEQFAYAASHDLKEPLRMVTSYLELLERRYGDELDEDAEEFIDFAVDGADRMREMIEGLLEYSRIETQGDPFERVDLDDVLADVREDLQLQIEESDATISADSLPRVEGDRGQLRQVLQNLLNNAIEYSGDEPPRVHVTAARDGAEWLVSVTDEGVGVPPDEQDRVFEVFQRLHSHEEHEGTGIGLAICRRIVERHGGEIWIDSDPDEGTTVSFTLPAHEE